MSLCRNTRCMQFFLIRKIGLRTKNLFKDGVLKIHLGYPKGCFENIMSLKCIKSVETSPEINQLEKSKNKSSQSIKYYN